MDFLKWGIKILLDNSIHCGCQENSFWNKSWPQEQYLDRTSRSPVLGYGPHSCASQQSTRAKAGEFFWRNVLQLEDNIDTYNHSWVYLTVPWRLAENSLKKCFQWFGAALSLRCLHTGNIQYTNCSCGLTLAAKVQVKEWSSMNFTELKKVGFGRTATQLLPSQFVTGSDFSQMRVTLSIPFLSCLGKPHPVLCIHSCLPARPCVPQLLGITFMALPQDLLCSNSLTTAKPTLKSPKSLPVAIPGFLRIPNSVVSESP